MWARAGVSKVVLKVLDLQFVWFILSRTGYNLYAQYYRMLF